MDDKREFPYSAKEMSRRIEHYFLMCDMEGKKYTVHGLCLALGITVDKYIAVLKEAENAAKPEDFQNGHARLLQMARLRINDCLEQYSDSMSIMRAKQPGYCNYSDKGGSGETPEAVTIRVLIGGVEKIDPGG